MNLARALEAKAADRRRRLLWIVTVLAAGGCPAGLPRNCDFGEVLVASNEGWHCQSLENGGNVGIPQCNAGEILAVQNRGLKCVFQSSGAAARIAAADQALGPIEQLQQSLAKTAKGSLFVGLTTATTAGRIDFPGTDPGLFAAGAHCAAEYPGSHMCSVFELYSSVAAGRLKSASQLAKSWLYFPARNTPLHPPSPTENGLSDNCAGYTYGADDRGYSGLAVEWTKLPTGSVGFKFHGGVNAPCSAALPIACCQPGGA